MVRTMTDDEAQDETTPDEETVAAPNPAKKIGLVVLVVRIVIVACYSMADRLFPGTTRGYVMANVVRIAQRVSGQVHQVNVVDNAFVKTDAQLFEVGKHPFELAVAQAKTQLQQAHQSLEASSAQLLASQAEPCGKTHARRMSAQRRFSNAAWCRDRRSRPRAPTFPIPVRIMLGESGYGWPQKVHVGAKVSVLIQADSRGNPMSVVSGFMFRALATSQHCTEPPICMSLCALYVKMIRCVQSVWP